MLLAIQSSAREVPMLRIMIDNWWLLAFRAIFALLVAAAVFFVDGANLPLLLRAFAHASTVVLFGLLAFGAGVFTLGAALRRSSRGHDRGLLLADGIGTSVAGAIAVAIPSLTLLHLAWIIGCWAVFVGICQILMAHKIRRHLHDEWSLVLAGVVSLGFGVFMLFGRVIDDHTVLVWLGSYALFSAFAMSGLSYRLWQAGTAQRLSIPPF
jgi:uncharacterized membrane protein HdeD (DUF308 family)